MERPRRSGVRSTYARPTDGEEGERAGEGVTGAGDVDVVRTTPHTTHRPGVVIKEEEDTPASTRKRGPSSTASSPAKRGRPPKQRPVAYSETDGSAPNTQAEASPLAQPSRRRVASVQTIEKKAEAPQLNEAIVEDTEAVEDAEHPPALEMCENKPSQGRSLLGGALSRRGRPVGVRSAAGRDRIREIEEEDIEEEENDPNDTIMTRRSTGVKYMYPTDVLDSFNEPGLITTEIGDKFLKVREGALGSLLKRENILSLIVNDTERAEQNDWVNMHVPAIPPLTSHVGTYIAFVDTRSVDDAKFITTDGLSPWSSSQPLPTGSMTPTRPKVRKWAVYLRGGEYQCSGEDWRSSLYILVEYSALLPRAPRLRKRVYYMTRDRTLLGYAMIIYDYTEPGPLPTIVTHGSSRMYGRQRLEVVRFTDEEGNRSTLGIPVSADRPRISSLVDPNDMYDDDFDEIEGVDYIGDVEAEYDPETGPFVGDLIQSSWRAPDNFVRVIKGNWTSDKAMLLKYLVNDPESIPSFAVNPGKPHLPPLISTVGCFATFVRGATVLNPANLNMDALSPWTSQAIRTKTRKLAVEVNENGEYVISKKDWRNGNIVLSETCATLARCPRLRKRMYYVIRNNITILGYILFMYEYTAEGEPPTVMAAQTAKHLVRRPPSNKYYEGIKDIKMDDSEDMHIDVMDVGEEVEVGEVDMLDGDMVVPEQELEEDATVDAAEEQEWMNEYGMPDNYIDVFEGQTRQTALGERYIVAKTRRLIGDKNLILRYIVNDQRYAYERGIVLDQKPTMPPLSTQCGMFVFFCSSDRFDLRHINKDNLSPWSCGDNDPEVGKAIRTKVKKYALKKESPRRNDEGGHLTTPDGKEFRVDYGADWHQSEYVLVQLYSVLPRCQRLHKKVFYVMDQEHTQSVCGHIMIVYEYVEQGEAPRPVDAPRRGGKRRMMDIEPMDEDEMDRDCPFDLSQPAHSRDSSVYLTLLDTAFLMDRNRQLHYLVNRASTIERHGVLNAAVPLFPPLIADKGDFVFFVSGADLDARNLTCDGLAPWSDAHLPQATRPKSRKLPVERSRDGILRYVGGTRWEQTPYYMVVYYAALPRCPRLKKRILYVCNQEGEVVGNAMIIYSYTEDGQIPYQVPHGNATNQMTPFFRMPPSLRDEAKRMLADKRPGEVAHVLTERSPSVSTRTIYNITKSMKPRRYTVKADSAIEDWDLQQGFYGRGRDHYKVSRITPSNNSRFYDAEDAFIDVVADNSIEVGHSEEITSQPIHVPRNKPRSGPVPGRGVPAGLMRTALPRHIENKKKQKIMELIQQETGLSGENETLDYLWRLVVERNERRVLDNIRKDFGVEIVTNDYDGEDEETVEWAEENKKVVVDIRGGIEETIVETEATTTEEVPIQ